MTLSFSTTIRDQVCRNLFNETYANLGDANAKSTIDFVGADALVVIQKYAQYAEQAGATAAPDEWANWLLWRATMLAGISLQPDRTAMYERHHEDAMQAALGSFARTDLAASALGTESLAITVKGIRRYVIATALGRTRGSRRGTLLVDPSLVDSEIQWALGLYFNHRGFNFRRRKITLTIGTDSTVTVNGLSGETLDQINTDRLYYSDAVGSMGWLNADEMARRKAYDAEHQETGRPFGFRIENKSGTWTWTFTPDPDQQYTVYAEALVSGPGTPSTSTETTVFQRFNAEDGPLIRDLVLGKILMTHGHGSELHDEAMAALDRLSTIHDDFGQPDNRQAARDVYGDFELLGGWCGGVVGEGG